jgi:predicted aldo/keto reductase-like oxidoreductase
METYLDPQWGIIDYFKEQKRLGRIRHLGFSTHAATAGLEKFLDACGEDMEFCQIQLNYLDWTLQDAASKYELLAKRGIPVWVMEPVRGGKLAALQPETEAKLKALRPDESVPAWCFRFLQRLPEVTVVLSGMSNMAQVEDNVKTFAEAKPLTGIENAVILEVGESLKNSVPCTGCRYCCDGCPMGLDIPDLIATYNELRVTISPNSGMRIEFMPDDKKPTACIGCGKCTKICPQNIDIPGALKDLSAKLAKTPSWAAESRRREEIARKLKGL